MQGICGLLQGHWIHSLCAQAPRAHHSWLMPPMGKYGGRTMMPYGKSCTSQYQRLSYMKPKDLSSRLC